MTPNCHDYSAAGRPYTDEEREFLAAVEDWMRRTGRKFPSFTDVLAVASEMGYVRVNEFEVRVLRFLRGEEPE